MDEDSDEVLEIAEENSDSEYDSSDYDQASDEDDDDESDNDGKDSKDDEVVSEIADVYSSIDGKPLNDEDILKWCGSKREEIINRNLLPKIRRYLSCNRDSKGFDCIDYPIYISTVTSHYSKQRLIDQRDRYPEGYNHIMFMASMAMEEHNIKCNTEFKVKCINKVTTDALGTGDRYYITFAACDLQTIETFQCKVWQCTSLHDWKMTVEFFRPKPRSSMDDTESSDSFLVLPAKEEKSCDEEQLLDEEESFDTSDSSIEISVLETRRNYTDEDLLKLIEEDPVSAKKDKNKLLRKICKYFDSVIESEGFECDHFPGPIPGITTIKPRQKIISYRDYHSESDDHLSLMAKMAIDSYNRVNGTVYKVRRVEKANSWNETGTYYITFLSRCKPCKGERFEAKVKDGITYMDVMFCRQKLNCYSLSCLF